MIQGNRYLAVNFEFYPGHLWRNLGIMLTFLVFLGGLYLLSTEYIRAEQPNGDKVIFQYSPKAKRSEFKSDVEEQDQRLSPISRLATFEMQYSEKKPHASEKLHAATFLWHNISCDVKTKGDSRRLLNDVDGWIKPGTLTALMGVSGAGKTTLLNILAKRASVGVVSGHVYIDSENQHGVSTKDIGFAQQRDLHNPTSTVKEALLFSAILRQSNTHSEAEREAHVDEIINQLDKVEFADAVIGSPGAGLNVEQRKRLTIGVELAAQPALLLFLNELLPALIRVMPGLYATCYVNWPITDKRYCALFISLRELCWRCLTGFCFLKMGVLPTLAISVQIRASLEVILRNTGLQFVEKKRILLNGY